MGYPADQATVQAENDKLKEESLNRTNAKDGKFIGRDLKWTK